jgi:hypothetical protein
MKVTMLGQLLTIAGVMALGTAGPGHAAENNACHIVSGRIFELEVPANEQNNPINHGRVVGEVTGSLKGAETAILTGAAAPPPGGSIAATTQNVFVNKEGEMLVTDGVATFAFNPDGTVTENLTLTVNGAASTGRFAGTTGTIVANGIGFNFGGGPGVGRFVLRYRGQICGLSSLFEDE